MMRFEGAAPGPRLGGVMFEPAAEVANTQWASAEVSVTSEEPQQVSLYLQPGLTVTGVVRPDATRPPRLISQSSALSSTRRRRRPRVDCRQPLGP